MFEDMPIIFSYTRAQAIEDGVLVDLAAGELAEITRPYFKIPVACTSTVWTMIEVACTHDSDVKGVVHDVVTCAAYTARQQLSTDIVNFQCIIDGRKRDLKMHIGPGDAGEPVLTLMFPDED